MSTQDNKPDTLITFRNEYNYQGQPNSACVITTDAVNLDDVIDAFLLFLKGSGFALDGRTIVLE